MPLISPWVSIRQSTIHTSRPRFWSWAARALNCSLENWALPDILSSGRKRTLSSSPRQASGSSRSTRMNTSAWAAAAQKQNANAKMMDSVFFMIPCFLFLPVYPCCTSLKKAST